LRTVVEASPIAIYTLTSDDEVITWNRAAERLFGWSAGEAVGHKLPLVPLDAADAYACLRREVLAGRSVAGREQRARDKSGAAVEMSVTLEPLRDDEGRIVGVIVMAQDIGERRRAERQRTHRLHDMQVILDAIPAPIFYKDADGIYRGCNRAFESYLGRTREQIVGMSVYDVAPKDLADIYRKADLDLLASRSVQTYESSVVYADGTRHDVIFNKATFLDADGGLGGLVGTILDITPRKAAERALRESEERYRAVVLALHEGIMLMSRDGELLACNVAAEHILGLTRHELAERMAMPLSFSGVDGDGVPLKPAMLPFRRTIGSGEPAAEPALGLDRRDGTRVWVSMRSQPLFHNGEATPFAVVISFADITERRRAEERLQHRAFHDSLTELPNRALFVDRLTHALAHAHRRSESLAVACLDLDGFKVVNDTFGHELGDRLLVEVGRRLVACARESDTVARMGGDEFMVILPNTRDRAQAAAAARRILEAMRPPLRIDGHELRLSLSIGITLCPHDGDDVATLMRNADRAMYRAKELGKNDFRLFGPDDDPHGPSRLALENQLHRAIENRELCLEFQPQIDLRTGSVVAAEALLRWQSRTLGLVMPERFIPIAEQTGMIVALGEWVLREACLRMVALPGRKDAARVAVNVSAVQFRRDDFVAMVRRVLSATGLPAQRLELELKEAAMMGDTDWALERITQLHAMGITVALDDFGTGYSSLNYLRRLPIDTLKIDRSCVQDLDRTRLSKMPVLLGEASGGASREALPSGMPVSIVQPIIALAHSLGMIVVAEGVETQAQLGMLRDLGCDRVQGFAVGRPRAEPR
jgi:diguanylate cyclase (GGDEF)-like protein/PAS domain S-box-containing protein